MPYTQPGGQYIQTETTKQPRLLLTTSCSSNQYESHSRQRTKSPETFYNIQNASGRVLEAQISSKTMASPPLRSILRLRPSTKPQGSSIATKKCEAKACKSVKFHEILEQVRLFREEDIILPADPSVLEPPVKSRARLSTSSQRIGTGSSTRKVLFSSLPDTKQYSKSRTLTPCSFEIALECALYSSEDSTLVGCIAVQNLAFQKTVTVRYTMDGWKTIHETPAEYQDEISVGSGGRATTLGLDKALDRFTFNIDLSTDNLQPISLELCLRYNVSGQEFWDNNDQKNYLLKLSEAIKPVQSFGRRRLPPPPPPIAVPAVAQPKHRHHRLPAAPPSIAPIPTISVEPTTAVAISSNAFSSRYDLQVALLRSFRSASHCSQQALHSHGMNTMQLSANVS